MMMTLPKVLRHLSPAYRLAQKKRELEKSLRAQGWSRQDARHEVAKRFGVAQ